MAALRPDGGMARAANWMRTLDGREYGSDAPASTHTQEGEGGAGINEQLALW